MRQKVVISEVIGVNKEAYIYLAKIQRKQRGCTELNEDRYNKIWDRLNKNAEGLRELDNDSMGGGDGTYNGKWWSWSVETIRGMLRDGGFEWVELGTRESIAVYI